MSDTAPIRIPPVGKMMRVESIKLAIRDGDGNDILEGVIPIEITHDSSGSQISTAIMRSDDLIKYCTRIVSSEPEKTKEDGHFLSKPVTYPPKIEEHLAGDDSCEKCGAPIREHR